MAVFTGGDIPPEFATWRPVDHAPQPAGPSGPAAMVAAAAARREDACQGHLRQPSNPNLCRYLTCHSYESSDRHRDDCLIASNPRLS